MEPNPLGAVSPCVCFLVFEHPLSLNVVEQKLFSSSHDGFEQGRDNSGVCGFLQEMSLPPCLKKPSRSGSRAEHHASPGTWWPHCGAITHMLQLGKPPAAHLRGTAAMPGSLPDALQHSWCVGSPSCRDSGCHWAARGCPCRACLPQVMDFSSGLSLRVKGNSAGEIPLLSHSKGNSKSFSSLAFLPAHLIAKSQYRGSPG